MLVLTVADVTGRDIWESLLIKLPLCETSMTGSFVVAVHDLRSALEIMDVYAVRPRRVLECPFSWHNDIVVLDLGDRLITGRPQRVARELPNVVGIVGYRPDPAFLVPSGATPPEVMGAYGVNSIEQIAGWSDLARRRLSLRSVDEVHVIRTAGAVIGASRSAHQAVTGKSICQSVSRSRGSRSGFAGDTSVAPPTPRLNPRGIGEFRVKEPSRIGEPLSSHRRRVRFA